MRVQNACNYRGCTVAEVKRRYIIFKLKLLRVKP